MKTVVFRHDDAKLGTAMGLDGDAIELIKKCCYKIIKRNVRFPNYKKSNELQDVITTIKVYCGENADEPITEKEAMIALLSYQLGLNKGSIEKLCQSAYYENKMEEVIKLISKSFGYERD